MKFSRPKNEIVSEAIQKANLQVGEAVFFANPIYQKHIFQIRALQNRHRIFRP